MPAGVVFGVFLWSFEGSVKQFRSPPSICSPCGGVGRESKKAGL